MKKGVLENFSKFTVKLLCQSLLIKLQALGKKGTKIIHRGSLSTIGTIPISSYTISNHLCETKLTGVTKLLKFLKMSKNIL